MPEFLALNKASAFIVGGAVRDFLLKRPLSDIDMATDLPPQKGLLAFKKAGLKVIPTGITHGTITVVINDKNFEITTFRKDIKTDGRHANVKFTRKMSEDAARRDFTVNALYMAENGEVFDFFSGKLDLQQSHLRFIGEAKERIKRTIYEFCAIFVFWLSLVGNLMKQLLKFASR